MSWTIFEEYASLQLQVSLPKHTERSGNSTWTYRGRRSRIPILDAAFSTLSKNLSSSSLTSNNPSTETLTEPKSDDFSSVSEMSLAYAKLLKLKKRKEELQRILQLLTDMEEGFLGDRGKSTFVESKMQVQIRQDYMLSPGNPESTLESGEPVTVYGYLGHNMWRCVGPYCRGQCPKSMPTLNPNIKLQNVSDVEIVCSICNRITVPLIGAIPNSILESGTVVPVHR